MRAFVATRNPGKLRELKAIFVGSALQIEPYEAYAEVVEDADSYVGNALLKARALARQLLDAGITASTLADDSGLEVDELENRPGIHSARYGGDEIGWPQRRAALLAELDGVPEAARTARFLCTMALVKPDGDAFIATGEVEGRLLTAEQGTGGFGYDSLFYCPPLDRTFAEITEDEKNVVSHRRRAADALLEALRDSE